MKLLQEYTSKIEILSEGENGAELYLKGIFIQTNSKNKNGRVYPKSMMEDKVRDYDNLYIKQKKSMGELEHPNTPKIKLDRVSHLVEYMGFDGDDVIGKAKIMPTPCGDIARGLIKGGAQLGVSSRGVGSTKKIGDKLEVQPDFILRAIDIVPDPSAHDAWVSGIYENASWVYENGIWKMQEIEEAKKELSNKYTEEKAIQLFTEFIKKLKFNKY